MTRVFVVLAILCHIALAPSGVAAASPITGTVWQAVELTFNSQVAYPRPFYDVDMTATFTGPSGVTIERPAFWDGGSSWKVRFAATKTGRWSYATKCSDKSNKGLDGRRGTIDIAPYRGDLAIYKHGFVTVSPNRRYFVYADGTPFFYLGDTHWFMMRERFDASNLPGCPSQFKRCVDVRVDQGFTVYQCQCGMGGYPGSAIDGNYDWHRKTGIDDRDLAGFHNVDRKIQYLAEKGMVIANAMAWRSQVLGLDDDYLRRLARNWSARYAAYPMLWTMGQEIDGASPGEDPMLVPKWQTTAEALAASDAYHHPLSAHMHEEFQVTASTSLWRDKPYHTWYAMQNISNNGHLHKDGPIWNSTAKDYWDSKPTKPAIVYEDQYENWGTDVGDARINAYAPYLCGFYGIGYGVAAIWDDRHSPDFPSNQPPTLDGTCGVWYEALDRPSGVQMSYMRKFFDTLKWWTLIPRYDMDQYLTVADPHNARLASSDTTVVALLWGGGGAVLHRLAPGIEYTASWYDPRLGQWNAIGNIRADSAGNWTVPSKPAWKDYLLVLRRLVTL